MILNKKFTPIDYLDKNEITLLNETKQNIKKAKNKEQLIYFENVLDTLLKSAIQSYRAQHRTLDNREMQEA